MIFTYTLNIGSAAGLFDLDLREAFAVVGAVTAEGTLALPYCETSTEHTIAGPQFLPFTQDLGRGGKFTFQCGTQPTLSVLVVTHSPVAPCPEVVPFQPTIFAHFGQSIAAGSNGTSIVKRISVIYMVDDHGTKGTTFLQANNDTVLVIASGEDYQAAFDRAFPIGKPWKTSSGYPEWTRYDLPGASYEGPYQ